MHTLLSLWKLVGPFNVLTVKESQRIFKQGRIIHCIVHHSRYLILLKSSDVPPDWNTKNVGQLVNHKQQSITTLSLNRIETNKQYLNDGIEMNLM